MLAFQPIVSGSIGGVVGIALAFGADPDPYTRGELFYNRPHALPASGALRQREAIGTRSSQWPPGQDLNYADMTFVTTVSPVPEPSTLGLIGLGLLGLGAMRRRRQHRLPGDRDRGRGDGRVDCVRISVKRRR
jgi:PEP-CTERM motif